MSRFASLAQTAVVFDSLIGDQSAEDLSSKVRRHGSRRNQSSPTTCYRMNNGMISLNECIVGVRDSTKDNVADN